MSLRFIRMATVYAVIGICLGVYMGATQHFEAKAVHVHALLAGWLSLAVMGLIYRAFRAMDNRWATAHFWLHNLGLPVMLVGVFLIYHGQPADGGPIAGLGSAVLALGFLAFVVNVWLNARD